MSDLRSPRIGIFRRRIVQGRIVLEPTELLNNIKLGCKEETKQDSVKV